mmetsp:Transcript_21763/g.62411  ORF Transcript_21763/g.62411 Transcript_21763/m.62411 type:complete len:354 (+) Transcript_21763:686-1747(+)
MPMPMRAVPALLMTDRTSAKSTLIRPGLMMMSEIPTTPWRRMSSATANARLMGVSSGMMSSSLSLETTMTVSTCALSRLMPPMACVIRFRPSKAKGLVTMPTVSDPASLATSATTGAAPVPVPPPMPLVTKQRSVPWTMAAISLRDSSAAICPTSGLPPAPRPRVAVEPMLRTLAPRALDRPRAWASVLMAQKSTPPTLVSSIRSTALHPPPPTPMTLMTQGLRPPSGMMAPVSSSYMGRMVPEARSLRRRPANEPRSGLQPRAMAEAKVSAPSSLPLTAPLLLPKATNRAEEEEEAAAAAAVEEVPMDGTEWAGETNALADPMARPVRARMATAVFGYIIFGLFCSLVGSGT